MNSVLTQAPAAEGQPTELDRKERFDLATGIPNGTQFRVALLSMLEEAAAKNEDVALLWVDVTNLRLEYALGGDAAAERLLAAVAGALQTRVGEGELVCRYGDHSFLLALRSDDGTESRLERILESASPREIHSVESRPEIAAGIAMFPQDATAPAELIRFASMAATHAMQSRSRTAIPFLARMNRSLVDRRELERDLRAALRQNRLTFAYQPQIDLATGAVTGVEGLARWNHPVRGEVAREAFISVAEQSDLIDQIFAQALRQLLADARSWRAAGYPLASIAVNASAANIRNGNFVDLVVRELAAQPLGETQLNIEVTESLLIDDEDLFRERLNALRNARVKLSLDDFGTRYTGFNTLKALPLHSMKIDKCFVRRVNRSLQAESLSQALVAMARELGLGTVAEGIENLAELRVMQRVGCEAGQGYLFSRPVNADRLLRFLQCWPERRNSTEFAGIFKGCDGAFPAFTQRRLPERERPPETGRIGCAEPIFGAA